MWLLDSMGGAVTLSELQRAANRPGAAIDRMLLEEALTPEIVSHLDGMRGHVRIGNALFVHGGLDPNIDETQLLARPWTQFTDARWAWINRGFLDWKGGFKGTLVVHGHTPPPLHRANPAVHGLMNHQRRGNHILQGNIDLLSLAEHVARVYRSERTDRARKPAFVL